MLSFQFLIPGNTQVWRLIKRKVSTSTQLWWGCLWNETPILVSKFRKDIGKLRGSRRSATEIFRGLKNTSQFEAVEHALVQSGKEHPILGYNYLWRSYKMMKPKLSLQQHVVKKGKWPQAAPWEILIENIHYVSNAVLKQLPQSGCRISILGGFQNLSRKRHCWPDLMLTLAWL